jgi:hypothetical protein
MRQDYVQIVRRLAFDVTAAFKGASQRYFIGIFEISADWQAAS